MQLLALEAKFLQLGLNVEHGRAGTDDDQVSRSDFLRRQQLLPTRGGHPALDGGVTEVAGGRQCPQLLVDCWEAIGFARIGPNDVQLALAGEMLTEVVEGRNPGPHSVENDGMILLQGLSHEPSKVTEGSLDCNGSAGFDLAQSLGVIAILPNDKF